MGLIDFSQPYETPFSSEDRKNQRVRLVGEEEDQFED